MNERQIYVYTLAVDTSLYKPGLTTECVFHLHRGVHVDFTSRFIDRPRTKINKWLLIR